MIDLERSLGELAGRLEIPNGDWMARDVVRRIGEPQRHPAIGRVPRLTGALVALVVVALVVLPGPRHAVARWLGFDSVRIEPGVTVPPTTSGSTTSQTAPKAPGGSVVVEPTTIGVPDLGLGSSVSIERARSATGLPDPTPALLGDPHSVHVVQPPATGQIVLVYSPSALVPQSTVIGAGAVVSVMPAHIEAGFFQKTLGTTSTVRSVDVNGDVGYWIEGSPHQLLFDFGDQIQQDTLRLATNTLLWQRGDHVYRIEADVDLETALRIATSIP
ncbi:MAG: hypothetical protein JJD93_12410 [Ilumatobacteraceae bacterium]|nr:hypothetical protein [Ilumatobacteraceae bacterium]